MSGMILSGTFGYTLFGYTQALDLEETAVSSPALAKSLQSPAGYIPTSEIGYFHFDPSGSVSGAVRFSPGVGADAGNLATFDGLYRFNGAPMGGGRIVPLGVIAVRLANESNVTLDYSFIVIDDTEIMLTSAARMPRPGVLVGTMKRIHAPILTPGGSGSRKG
jgi:hypothetical protein